MKILTGLLRKQSGLGMHFLPCRSHLKTKAAYVTHFKFREHQLAHLGEHRTLVCEVAGSILTQGVVFCP